jgi:2-desacetyl-2-hydroxyethyl bacteriochlorophyllide A dehydrogenase
MMERRMKALVAYAPYDYRYEDVPVPQVEKGEMLLKVETCGICAGDIKAYHGGARIWGVTPEKRYIEAPCVGGHEFVGTVVELGPGVTGFNMGDRVVSEQIVPCWDCDFCRQGRYWMCTSSAVYGFKQRCQGGFAEYVKLPARSINHRVPRSFTNEQAALVEPIACGMHAVELAEIRHDDVVVIAGLGAIGLAMTGMVRLALPRLIIGIDMKPERLKKGLQFGADLALNPAEGDLSAKIAEHTRGLGCDVYIEVSGSPASVNQGINSLKNLGRYVQMGVFAGEVQADWNVIGDGKELIIKGSHLSALTYGSTIKGIESGLIKTEGLISHSFPLKDWEKAFETAEKDPGAVKVALTP